MFLVFVSILDSWLEVIVVTVKNLVETMVFSRTDLIIKDDKNKQVAYVSGGYDSEYSEYADCEVMEIYSVQPFQIIAHIWL